MRGRLIWVGRERAASPPAAWAGTYLQRLQSYGTFDEKTIKPLQGANRSAAEIRAAEGKRIVEALEPRDFVVVCDERGKQMSSRELANFLREQRERATPRLVWVIGGSMGIDDAVRNRAGRMLSLSKMTLPHALARVILLEQLYRAHAILQGHPYHHD